MANICQECGNTYSKTEVPRVNGDESQVYKLDFCCASCYTKNLLKPTTETVVDKSNLKSFDLKGVKIEIDNTKYVRAILNFFNITEYSYKESITYIKAYETNGGNDDSIELEIETHYPGILIGKAGRYINKLTDYLNTKFEEKIKINLKECTLWHIKY